MLSSKIYYYGLLVDYVIDKGNHETWELLQMWLVIIFAENLNASLTYLQQQEQTEFVKDIKKNFYKLCLLLLL